MLSPEKYCNQNGWEGLIITNKLIDIRNSITRNRKIIPFIFISPFFTIFLIFWVAPIVSSLFYSLTDWGGVQSPTFIGFKNYFDMLSDPRFYKAFKNTIYFVIVYNVIMISLALLIALLLDQNIAFSESFRTIYLIPVSVSLVVVAIIFDFILSKNLGLLNNILREFGFVANFGWLEDPDFSMWSIIIMRVWRATGYYAVIILAGLKSIPRELYEAAQIDGANSFQISFRIKLPLIIPILFFVIAMSTIWSFKLFDEPWVLTGGGPARSTLTLGIYIYQEGFLYMKLGFAAAVSYFLTFLIVTVSIIEGKLLKEI